jgi:threonine dehydratase
LNLPSLQEIEDAAELVHRWMLPTPQIVWPLLNAAVGAEVWVKHENHTPLGAFKIRGGVSYFCDLTANQNICRGVVAATKGNHGQSVAYCAKASGLRAVVVVPLGNSCEKNAAMRAHGAELLEFGEDFQAALDHASQVAVDRDLHLVPSFDPLLVRGVASYSLELFREVSKMDTLYVPIGLGSGICGAIAARDGLRLHTEIVGVVAQAAPAYAKSYATGRILSAPVSETLADGIACSTPHPEALEIIRNGAARIVSVSEGEIGDAMRLIFLATHNLCEGAGAASLAALMQERERMRGKRVAVVLSGANIDAYRYIQVLAEKRG